MYITIKESEGIMKILLVLPSKNKNMKNAINPELSLLTLNFIAEMAPAGHDVTIIDENKDTLPLKKRFNLVALSVVTANAQRAYEISRFYRIAGVPVVIGGCHPTLNPLDAMRHADSIVVGPILCAIDINGELINKNIWKELLFDLQRGYLKKIYHISSVQGIIPDERPEKKSSIHGYRRITGKKKNTSGCILINSNDLYTGCSPSMNNKKIDVDEAVRYVMSSPRKSFILVDDNILSDKIFAFRLFNALVPLKIKWSGKISVFSKIDENIINLMALSGCTDLIIDTVMIGDVFKSYCEADPEQIKNIIRKFHNCGINCELEIHAGYDNHDLSILKHILKTAEKSGADKFNVIIPTPIPGTKFYTYMEHRIFDHDLSHYDGLHAVYSPAKITASELTEGINRVMTKFNSPLRKLKRLFRFTFLFRAVLRLEKVKTVEKENVIITGNDCGNPENNNANRNKKMKEVFVEGLMQT